MMSKNRAVSSRRYRWTLPALVLALGAIAVPAQAQDFPSRTVKIVVPFPAGGTADVMPRIIADWLSRNWGQSVIIEDRTGAGGNVGAEVAAKADPDGYTLLSSPPPPLVINQNLYPHLDFDPLQFVPITVIGRVPNALVVNPDKIAANTVKDFIAYAKANDGKLTNATQGNGTTSHLTSEMFQMMAQGEVAERALSRLGAGAQRSGGRRVDCMFDNLGVSMQLVKAGKLKLLAVASPQRVATLARRADRRRDAAGLCLGDLVCAGRAAEHAGRDRREDQCRSERSAARSRRAEAPRRSFRRAGRRHAAGHRRLFSRRSRALEKRHHVRPCDFGLSEVLGLSEAMKHSTDRILTTHAGSLPRPPDLLALIERDGPKAFDSDAAAKRLTAAVGEIVHKQIDLGVDVVDDGEYGKPSFVSYINERLGGYEVDTEAPGRATNGRRRARACRFRNSIRRPTPPRPTPI